VQDFNEVLNSFGVASGCMAVAVLISAMLARSRGYSAVFYGSLALFLSFGAIPLTLLATSEPHREEEPGELGFSPVSTENAPSVDPDLASWRRLYRAIRDSLLLGGLAAAVVAVLALGYGVTSILPTFVALFEGMSLALPLPTQVLISVTKLFRNPDFAPIFWFLKLTWPAALFFFLARTGYWFPLLGGVWKSADRLWQIQASRHYGNQWRQHVPPETARRLFSASDIPLPEEENDYQAILRRQREALQASLWMLIPGLVPMLGIGMALIWLIGISIFLPMYQIIGNIGG
jgi:hypothetical protein